ncbi:HNH endonuclease signature motif containing protein, partial [Proteus penneri]|uniref:HNH endonuclease signature motif containing protein n=1 Tax=Proteus penneri TaxID=102862 RepID=UPI0034D4FB6C
MKKRNVYGGRWAKVRLVFLNEHPLCVMCQEQGRVTAATVVDHITPHRLKEALESGNKERIAKAQALFWDTKNFQ